MHWALVQKDSFAQGLSNRTQIFCHHVQVAKGVVSESYKVLHKKRYQNSRIEERVNMRANLAMIESYYLFGCGPKYLASVTSTMRSLINK